MNCIEKLTEEQAAKMPEYVERWTKIGLSCEPADFEQCKLFAKMAYKSAGLEKMPTQFLSADSPASAITAIKKLDPDLTNQNVFSEMMYGNHDAGWLSFYDFMISEVGVKNCDNIKGLLGISKNCGWWSAYEDVVIFQNRPKEIHLNDEGEIHNEEGPAILYRDGYAVWGISGKRVTEQIIMSPETMTIKQISSETDLDLRSIMIDRFGWSNYIEQTNAECIDSRDNILENTKEALYKTEFGNRMIVSCPTGRVFSVGVHDSVKSCSKAQSWLGSESDFDDGLDLLGNKVKVNVIART